MILSADDPMKTSSIRFTQLRRLLLDLHFSETRKDASWRFEHPASGTLFLFRPYAPDCSGSVEKRLPTFARS
jgi:hypothetical protein